MEVSNVAKVGCGILGTGAVVGSAGYGVYEISNKENYKNLREKFEKEKKKILKVEGVDDYDAPVAGISDKSIWDLLVKYYESVDNQDKRFKDLHSLTENGKTKSKILQEKCSSILTTGLENEIEAITWCTRSSSLLPDFSSDRTLDSSSINQAPIYSFPMAPG